MKVETQHISCTSIMLCARRYTMLCCQTMFCSSTFFVVLAYTSSPKPEISNLLWTIQPIYGANLSAC